MSDIRSSAWIRRQNALSAQALAIEMQAGKVKREDYEYEREGMESLFVEVEPLASKRIIQARLRRTKADWTYFMRDVLDGSMLMRRK